MKNISGIDHIDIVVQDPPSMSAFLQSVGFVVLRHTEHGGGSIELIFPGEGQQPILELTSPVDANGKSRPLGLRHMALRSNDLRATFEDFKLNGLPVKGEPRLVPETGRTLVNLIDPEGGTLQFVDSP